MLRPSCPSPYPHKLRLPLLYSVGGGLSTLRLEPLRASRSGQVESREWDDCELRTSSRERFDRELTVEALSRTIANRANAAGPTDSTSVEAAPIGLNWTGQWGHFFCGLLRCPTKGNADKSLQSRFLFLSTHRAPFLHL